MKYFLAFCFFLFSVYAESFSLQIKITPDINKSMTYEQLNDNKTLNHTRKEMSVSNVFAYEYLKNHLPELTESDELEIVIKRYLAEKHKRLVMSQEKSEITEEQIKSYYYDHYDDFFVDTSYNYFEVMFDSKEKADTFRENLLKSTTKDTISILNNQTFEKFFNIEVTYIPKNLLVVFNNLDPWEPSDAIKTGANKYTVLFYVAKQDPKYHSFDSVKKTIAVTLTNKRYLEIIEEEYNRILREW